MQNTLAVLKVTGLLLFVALGLSFGHGTTANLATAAAPTTATGVLLALVPIMFCYSGWNAAAYVAEEVRDPGRNVPRALALGTASVTLIYLALNVLFVYAFPVERARWPARAACWAARPIGSSPSGSPTGSRPSRSSASRPASAR